MTITYLSLEALAPALQRRALILVPNNRLRNHLLRAFALQQTADAWLKPNIQSLSQWLETQWDAIQYRSTNYSRVAIASTLQRQLLWESCIKKTTLGAGLIYPKPLAQQADSAFKHCELWRIDVGQLTQTVTDSTSNAGQFLVWAREFKHALKLQQCVTRETSYALIAKAFASGNLPRVEAIYLEGFDDLPPLMEHILTAATPQLIRLPNQEIASPRIHRTEANSAEDEIRAAALWSKEQLEQSPTSALIGIVVPNLGQCRQLVERVFTEVFEAHSVLPDSPRYTLPFNFSAGVPLGTTPLIHTAFEILRLQDNEWTLDQLCYLLSSPFWGDETKESLARAQMIAELHKLNRLNFTLSDLHFVIHKIESHLPTIAPLGLEEKFMRLANLLRRRSANKTASEWLSIFDHVLVEMNWPGARRLDSQEYQQLAQWFETKDQFACMDAYAGPMNYLQACRYLRELADTTPFQAQTPDSPIQILGALEAAGLQFSHLWVMGLSDNQWPPAPTPNPLLPLSLQREYKMPHASAERELEIALGLTQRYKQSAQQIIFSSAQRDTGLSSNDNEQRPSALIRDIPLTELHVLLRDQMSSLQKHYQHLRNSAKLECIQDATGPRANTDNIFRGGSNIFKYQAACPFEAFARLRLGANNPDVPSLGFNAAERGNLLHDSLAAIWSDIKDSNTLHSLDDSAIFAKVSEITERVIKQAQQRSPRNLGQVYCSLEQQRLTQLLCEWLANERERPAFKVIAIEHEDTFNFAGLTLKLRVDRIDEFANGDRLLVDYKTGQVSINSWLGERFTEPQLPLYAITREDITAISFAQINRTAQKWAGLGELHDTSLDQSGIRQHDHWPQQLAEWQKQLQQLADDFIAGDARVDFKNEILKSFASDLAPLTRLADADALYKFVAEQKR